jgi:ParB family chromosome partitioning protein
MPKPNLKAVALKALDHSAPKKGDHYVHNLARDEGFKLIPRALISPDPDQPRKHFDKQTLEELAASIREKGILQTLIVRPDAAAPGRFIVTSGERRWRAAGMIGLEELPCIIRTNPDAREIAIIENVQREDLAPLELAEALQNLKAEQGYTDAQLAKIIGKSRVAVTETLALNGLPDTIKDECRARDIAGKRQLLQVLRAGSPEKVRAAWEAVKSGEVTTTRALAKHLKPATIGRPKHLRLEYAPKGKPYRLTLTFAKKSATRADIRAALKAALDDLPKQLHA